MKCFFRVSCFVIAAAIGTTDLWAQSTPPHQAGPRAHIAEPAVNFGKLLPTQVKRHEFVVSNVGTDLLVVTDVSPACGCTTTGTWDREIKPGATGRIPIQFNPANFTGAVTKTISITTNDPTQPTRTLELQATVWRPFDVQPTFVSFLPIEGEPTTETKIVRIVNNQDQTTTVAAPESTSPRFKPELKTIRPGREFELHVTYDSAGAEPTPNASITIKTSSPDQPLLTISALAMAQPAVVVMPVNLQVPLSASATTHTIVIRNNSRAPLQLSAAATSVPDASVSIKEQEPGKLFHVLVALPANFDPPAGRALDVTLNSSHPKFSKIRVPIGVIRPSPTPATR